MRRGPPGYASCGIPAAMPGKDVREQDLLIRAEGDDADPEQPSQCAAPMSPKSPKTSRQGRWTWSAVAVAGLVAVGLVARSTWSGTSAPSATALRLHGPSAQPLRQNLITLEQVAAHFEEEGEDECAGSGASCLKSSCCKDAGMQCYGKDDYWAQCMVSCTPGPNVQDQVNPTPWACKALGNRTAGEPQRCSGDGEDCSKTRCCKTGGTQCFAKNKFWAACKPQCTPGPDMTEASPEPWNCSAHGPRNPGAAPWVASMCAVGGEDCSAKGCCAEPGNQCYRQSQYYAKCKASCIAGEKPNPWEPAWECSTVGMRTPLRDDAPAPASGMVSTWVPKVCSKEGENCVASQCCQQVGAQCYLKNEYWGTCKTACDTAPDPNDGNRSWGCNTLGPKSWGLAVKGWPSLYCFSLFMPGGYEGPLLKAIFDANAGIFQCDGYDVFAAEDATLGTKDNVTVKAILIPKIEVGTSQDGTAGNAKLFMAVWDKVIAGGRFKNYDWTLKVDPDAVLIAWRIRDHMRPHVGEKVYVVNCNKFPGSPNFPMMYGAVEIFSQSAMLQYASSSWKCGQQLPWASWGEDYYMTHCMDFIGVRRIADFGVLGDNVCTGANCADSYTASFHPFKNEAAWMQCWGQATAPPPTPAPAAVMVRKL
mmetsp:Transcript_37378/g.106051  ORF Transcript_37378/g.106051 Transcript_37378/m.106051 type:complete len:646 (+) Transcript_37378:40-1977(+)